MSEHEPESPGDSGTDLRHDSHHHDIGAKDTSDDQSDMETEDTGKHGTIGIRSDLLPMQPLPKEGLPGSQGLEASLHGLPALEALRRQAGAQAAQFLPGLPLPSFPQGQQGSRPSQPPTPQSTGSNDLGGSWTFEEQFKQVSEIIGFVTNIEMAFLSHVINIIRNVRSVISQICCSHFTLFNIFLAPCHKKQK